MSIFRRTNIDILEEDYVFFSKRYGKTTTAPKGFQCDGATGVPDTKEKCYRIHDWNYFAAIWDDGSHMTFEEANHNYTDILKEKGHWILERTRSLLYYLGRNAWSNHRESEMRWQNMKILARFRAERGLS